MATTSGNNEHEEWGEVKRVLTDPKAVFLDVRTEREIAEEPLDSRPFVHSSCMPDDCSELASRAEELLPDKHAPVVVFCRSGRRAKKAKDTLESLGYTDVYNAGGIGHLNSM